MQKAAWLDILPKKMDSFLITSLLHSLKLMLVQFFCVQIIYQIFRSHTFWVLKISKQLLVSSTFFVNSKDISQGTTHRPTYLKTQMSILVA